MADYDHSHIVPAGYLRHWAVGERLRMRLASDPATAIPVAPKDAGVRSGYTRERQPDGSYVNWLDPALAKLEGRAIDLMRHIEDDWQLPGELRVCLAEYMAVQVVRTPSWRDFYERGVPAARSAAREKRPFVSEAHMEAVEARLLEDGERHGRLLSQSRLLTTMFANMHWTLLRTGSPRLMTGDQPVVGLGALLARLSRSNAIPPDGVANMTEFRFALRPDLLLLMTWLDAPQTSDIQYLRAHHVRNHNAGVIGQADRQWFFHPDISGMSPGGAWTSIAAELYPGYGPAAARASQRRRNVDDMLREPLETGRPAEQVIVLTYVGE
jgi:hypothetical protein